MKPITIGALVFRRPDDAAAMRLVRALFAVAHAPADMALHLAFWDELTTLLLTPHDRMAVEAVRRALPPGHSNLAFTVRSHWLALQLGEDLALLQRTVETLARLPAGALGSAPGVIETA